jgi:hypothetical protein
MRIVYPTWRARQPVGPEVLGYAGDRTASSGGQRHGGCITASPIAGVDVQKVDGEASGRRHHPLPVRKVRNRFRAR